MSTLERRPGRVIFTRPGQSPRHYDASYYLALLVTGLCSPFMLVLEPMFGVMVSIVVAVSAVAFGLVALNQRITRGPGFSVVRKTFEISAPIGNDGYRDPAGEDELLIEGETHPKSTLREVVRGHFQIRSGQVTTDFYPVYLVFDGHVAEVASMTIEAKAAHIRDELAELLEVPAHSRDTTTYGTGVPLRFAESAFTLGIGLALALLPMIALISAGRYFAIPMPAFTALGIWLLFRVSGNLLGGRAGRGGPLTREEP